MSKGERTREMITAKAALLFNSKGYAGVSVADVMAATGLEKGGIYRHFDSKDDLALAAFDYNLELVRQRIGEAIRKERHAVARLKAILAFYRDLVEEPLLVGGCPILNTAVEADDTHPALRARARAAMEEFQATVARIVTNGLLRKEVRPDVDPAEVATVMTATIEGALMLSKLYGENVHMDRAIAHLSRYLESQLMG